MEPLMCPRLCLPSPTEIYIFGLLVMIDDRDSECNFLRCVRVWVVAAGVAMEAGRRRWVRNAGVWYASAPATKMI